MTDTRLFLLIGQNLIIARHRKGLSQEKVAEMSGISRQTISKLENGKTANLTMESLFALAEALDCPPEYFFKGKV